MKEALKRAFEAVEQGRSSPPPLQDAGGKLADQRQTCSRGGGRPRLRRLGRRSLALALVVALLLGAASWGVYWGQSQLDAWTARCAAAEDLTMTGDLADAEMELKALETELAQQPWWGRLPGFAGQREQLEAQTRKQRSALDEARRRYLAAMAATLGTLRERLATGQFDEALAELRRAGDDNGSDPVLESLGAFVKHRQKLKRAWDDADQQALDATLRDSIEWKGARTAQTTERYMSFLAAHPDSPFADEAKERIVDLEVARIVQGEHGELPSVDSVEVVPGRTYSVVNIHNDTAYELTLRYSGPDSFKVVFAPNEKGSVEVVVGKYNVAASVNAADVQNYAGKEESKGDNAEVKYYIETTHTGFGGYVPPTVNVPDYLGQGFGGLSEPPKFEPWANKRRAPDYLK